ncbi:hypothetical protein BKA70DRAFT_580097 [Coprinopsis sp. MPI-PUGE-AT-0042]|nr:hypothetical protein BKA70DRAFT_580097 [Coprinopsis sp. MPI-PUGE-AT-0042]
MRMRRGLPPVRSLISSCITLLVTTAVQAAAQGSSQTSTTSGSAETWYYGSNPLSTNSQVAGAQPATYYSTGQPAQQEETYVRQYQQWAESFTSGSQQNQAPFATAGQASYHPDLYTNLPGGPYGAQAPQPTQSVGVVQDPIGQQYGGGTSYQSQNPVNPAYSDFYGLVSNATTTTGHSSAQAHRPNQGLQGGGRYTYPSQAQPQSQEPPRVPQTQAVTAQYYQASEEAQRSQVSQRHAALAQRQVPSRDRTLSRSPVSWPSEGTRRSEGIRPAPSSAGAPGPGLVVNVHKPVQQVSEEGGQRSSQQHLSVPGPSNLKQGNNSAPPSLGGANKNKNKRKRIKRDDDTDAEDGDSAEESEDEDRFAGGISVGVAGFGVAAPSRKGRNKHSRL